MQFGQAHEQLAQPEVAGEISAAEANEIKALNDLVAEQEKFVQHQNRLLVTARAHRSQFLQRLVEQRGLDPQDLYNINDASGQILRTHKHVSPEVPDEANGHAPELKVVAHEVEAPEEPKKKPKAE